MPDAACTAPFHCCVFTPEESPMPQQEVCWRMAGGRMMMVPTKRNALHQDPRHILVCRGRLCCFRLQLLACVIIWHPVSSSWLRKGVTLPYVTNKIDWQSFCRKIIFDMQRHCLRSHCNVDMELKLCTGGRSKDQGSPSLPSMHWRRLFSLSFAWLEQVSRTSSSPVLKAVFSRHSRNMKKSSCVL